MELLLSEHKDECDWISITNADNIYGSNVIQQVKIAAKEQDEDISILLNPIDSRNFYNQDLVHRHLHHIWSQRCLEIESYFHLQLYGFTVQPQPKLGKVDLAAIFFRSKHLQSLLSMNKFPSDSAFFGKYNTESGKSGNDTNFPLIYRSIYGLSSISMYWVSRWLFH